MRWCVVVPVYVKNRPGFMWRWRSLDRHSYSRFCFTYFHDCVKAAQEAGFSVDMERTRECARQPELVSLSEYQRNPSEGPS